VREVLFGGCSGWIEVVKRLEDFVGVVFVHLMVNEVW
jgi:hypothetical protein